MNLSTSSGQMCAFNPLTLTLAELSSRLTSGALTSRQAVEGYLTQIKLHNSYLRAVYSVVDEQKLLTQAKAIDDARARGVKFGPLGGIPILLKDSIATDESLGIGTTGGSHALSESVPGKNAALVDLLLKADAIILGKATLSELSFCKGNGLPGGWSALVGQTQSAYVRGGYRSDDTVQGHSNPGGSSTGSAVSVSAGFCPAAIGAETDGSITEPANRAALYALKPTPGLISNDGIIPVSHVLDTAGPMAKTAEDVGILMDALAPSSPGSDSGKYTRAACNGSWDGISIGVLDPAVWQQPLAMIPANKVVDDQIISDINAAYDKLETCVQTFHRNVDLYMPQSFDRRNLSGVINHVFRSDMDHYLKNLKTSAVRSLQELVDWNKQHADLELPPGFESQATLERGLTFTLGDEGYKVALQNARDTGGKNGIDRVLLKYGVDVIIGPADSLATVMPTLAGYPVITLPLSTLKFNGRPFGLLALASKDQEELLLKVAGAWQNTFPSRAIPDQLVRSETKAVPKQSL